MVAVFGLARLSDAALRLSNRAVIVGLILGPVAGAPPNSGRALSISLGDQQVLVQSLMSATPLAIAAIALIAPFMMGHSAAFPRRKTEIRAVFTGPPKKFLRVPCYRWNEESVLTTARRGGVPWL